MPALTPVKKNQSAIKRARQTEVRTLRNKAVKSLLKTLAKKVEKTIADKNTDSAEKALKEAIPFGKVTIDESWRPPSMAQAWHITVPLEKIRFAGANRLRCSFQPGTFCLHGRTCACRS